MQLSAFSDADWAGCPTTRRSTTGFCTYLGKNCISWVAKKQPTVSRSSTEAEYRAFASAAAELCWLIFVLRDIGLHLTEPPILYSDNLSALHMTLNPVFHARTKHIEIDYYFVREQVAAGTLVTMFVPSINQVADIFTKALPRHLYDEFRAKLGLWLAPRPSLRGCEDNSNQSMAIGIGCVTSTRSHSSSFRIGSVHCSFVSIMPPERRVEGKVSNLLTARSEWLGTDGAPQLLQPRTPSSSISGLPDLPTSLSGYSYLIMKLGPLQLTRKGLSVASTASCLTFIIFQSASLCLATTTPEQLAFALRWFMLPLRRIGVPVAEIVLTLMLSLRFINLVFDEVRNVALGIVSRRINWQQLTTMETVDVFASYIRRIFKNIFSHAQQVSQAMIVRGFRGDSNAHKLYFLSSSSSGMANFISLLCLVGITSAALLSDYFLV
ncbi:ABC/ECF transporter, transmembrane component [Corchorus capsularis]|uniref:ABC/ECF transporter, transmembrane component n=1 Tax=Corchorus capsularis TaxID=210143 RepID=A0A1R3GAB9_COCAP|nr:ABC/ECF transporter, transmembrane component [Corchorus capsularis]